MERKERYTYGVIAEAENLLDTDTEMLHGFTEGRTNCLFCGKSRLNTEWAEECPVLLRCAIRILQARFCGMKLQAEG